jgi:hypothetical protein
VIAAPRAFPAGGVEPRLRQRCEYILSELALKVLTNRAPTHSLHRRGAPPTPAANGLQGVGGLFFILVGVAFLLGR